MGDNGSGKTTLLLALLGVIKSQEGIICLKGEDITQNKVAKRAKEFGLSFQNPNHQIFENTVFKEAMLPSRFLSPKAPEEIEGIINQLLEKFGLKSYGEKNPLP
ncbi:MAG: ATP-binding cassette domain-containing protein [Bacillota bacterium]